MSKMSVLSKVTVFSVLIALVLASFPTANVFAGAVSKDLEARWDQYVNTYERQSFRHNAAHKWAEDWLDANKDASTSKKEEIQKHLSICNSALASARAIVSAHAGFDAKGKVVDIGLASKSVNDLGMYVKLHVASVKNLKEHIR